MGPAEAADLHTDMACGECHLAGDDVTEENARALIAGQERLCGGCHVGAVEASHPIGFVPERPLPAELPLDWRGEMSCSTCHDLHAETGAHLRISNEGSELCLACHGAAYFEEMPDGGESLLVSGHLAAGPRPHIIIDVYSYRCMDCHEESASLKTGTLSSAYGTLVNHSIGVRYAEAEIDEDYRARASLPDTILLPEGQTSCLSCHQGYSHEHGELTRPRARLCLDCHIK